MANIKINNLQPTESELIELSQLEFEGIVGGGWFKDTFGISTPSWLKKIDRGVRKVVPGGWPTVIKGVISKLN